MSITTETERQREILQAVIEWGTRPSTRWLVVEGESGYSAQLDDYTRVQVWRSAVLVGPYNIHVPPEENTLYEHASKDWHVRLLATLQSSGDDAVQEMPALAPRNERLQDLLLEVLYFDALQHDDPNLMDEWQQRVWYWFTLQNRRSAAADEFHTLFDWRHDQKLAQRVPPMLRERLLPDCLRAHPVTVLGLAESDPRTHSALANGCSTIEDVVCLSDEQLLRLPRMGETRLARVREAQERVVAEILGTA